jgi:hypothetical protein
MTNPKPSQNKGLMKKLQKQEQTKALDRLHRAEARLQKRMTRVQRFEGQLALVRQQLDELNASPPVPVEAAPAAQIIAPSTTDEIKNATETADQVNEARAAAEAAEENVRLAVVRAAEATSRLGQELQQIEAEVDQSNAITQEAASAAQESEMAREETSTIPQTVQQEEENIASSQQGSTIISESETTGTGLETTAEHPQASPEELAEVEEIETEEEVVEAVTAITIAEIAAERAAAAEAFAQASSAHTREARRRAQLAEQALGEVRVAIRSGRLTGEEAENALQDAEREVTHAQAYLADAEATEEQAVTTAMNAEAEAEVAEGMAFAANHTAPLPGEEQGEREEAVWEFSQTYLPQEAAEEESDITLKIPHVRPQENA